MGGSLQVYEGFLQIVAQNERNRSQAGGVLGFGLRLGLRGSRFGFRSLGFMFWVSDSVQGVFWV